MAGAASAREGLETSVTDILEEDAFAAAFAESVKAETGTLEPEPEKPTETPVPVAAVEPEKPTETPAPVAAEPEKPAETPAPAASATEIGKAVAEALKAAEPAKVETPATEEEDSPEVKAALEDLEKNWGTHAVAVNALLEKQAKKLKAEFVEFLKPLQAQIAPMATVAAETVQAQFNAALTAAHPDAFTIIPDVEKWIEAQPAYLQPAYNKVLDEGSAAEVAKFLTDYKTATGKTAPAAEDLEAKAAAEKAEAERLAKLEKMKPPATTRTSVTAEPDPQDFDAAYEAGLKAAAALAA